MTDPHGAVDLLAAILRLARRDAARGCPAAHAWLTEVLADLPRPASMRVIGERPQAPDRVVS